MLITTLKPDANVGLDLVTIMLGSKLDVFYCAMALALCGICGLAY